MLNSTYSIQYAVQEDIDSWMDLLNTVRDNFPGLETKEGIDSYKNTVIKNIQRKTAICVKHNSEIVGALLFSFNSSCLSWMSVHPNHRRNGIGSKMVKEMLSLFPSESIITVNTFRNDDIKGVAPRSLYKKHGFIEDALITEFGYPNQKFIFHKK